MKPNKFIISFDSMFFSLYRVIKNKEELEASIEIIRENCNFDEVFEK